MIVDYLESVEPQQLMADISLEDFEAVKKETLKEKPQSFLEKKKNDRIGSSKKEKN